MKTTLTQKRRKQSLLPRGIPRYVRCYDNGGETLDRYTAIFCGRAAKMKSLGCTPDQWPLLAMNAAPFHPQGIGMHSHSNGRPADTFSANGRYCWPPAIGRKNHLGRRIHFRDLPDDCKKAVLQDYKEIWKLS